VPSEPAHDDAAAVWGRVRDELRASLTPSVFELWIQPLRAVSRQGSTLYVSAPPTARAWVQRRYQETIEATMRAISADLGRIAFVTETATCDTKAGLDRPQRGVVAAPIDPGHTFERFVIGSGNRLAHASALAVAELPGEAYNPLFLHGPPGLGKTHLLGAIVDYLQRRRPELTVHYTTAEQFTTDFVGALRHDGPDRFKERYRKLDALLIDDVQALEGKEQTQEEFVQTFNALHAAGKQIVLSSDRPPEAIPRLADRVRDRFAWGLRVELQVPDLRTRTALLSRMTLEGQLDLRDPAALREIASLVLGNVRSLQGAMTRVAAMSSILSEPVTPSLARQALRRSPPDASCRFDDPPAAVPSVESIQAAVCSTLGVSRGELLSPTRTARVIQARQLSMYLCRELTSLSLAQIARAFERDHSTVLHAVRSVSKRLDPGSDVSEMLERMRSLIHNENGPSRSLADTIHAAGPSPHDPSTAPPRITLP
jgi:chromosomal replication initiator protein